MREVKDWEVTEPSQLNKIGNGRRPSPAGSACRWLVGLAREDEGIEALFRDGS